jgi:Zn-dependent protease/predicted transcriptional regulator
MPRIRFPFLGYTVILHWSLLIGATVLTWGLATSYYPVIWPHHPRWVFWASGLLSTVLLFLCVLLHECAHAIVATRHNVPVKEIMLHIVGGCTMLPEELANPRLEAIVAIAGPACSAALALLMWPLAEFPIAHYVMTINIMLAVYNLLPAFPMDGGRLARAWFWYRTGSFAHATERASLFGKRIAFAMIVIGLGGLAFQQGTFWVMMGGVLLRLVADSTYQTVEHSRLLAGYVRDVMISREQVLCIQSDTSMEALHRLFLRFGYHAYPVVENGRITGVLSHEVARQHPDWTQPSQASIGSLVTPLTPSMTIASTAPVVEALDRMLLTRANRLFVFDRQEFVGLLTRSTITRLREEHRPQAAAAPVTANA